MSSSTTSQFAMTPAVQVAVSKLQRLSCLQSVYRQLFLVLGTPGEGENYMSLAAMMLDQYEQLRQQCREFQKKNKKNWGEPKEVEEEKIISSSEKKIFFEKFAKAINSAEEEEGKGEGKKEAGSGIESLSSSSSPPDETDWAISSQGCQKLFDVMEKYHNMDLNAAIRRGAMHLAESINKETEGKEGEEEDEEMQQKKGGKKQQLSNMTAEDKYSVMLLLSQQTALGMGGQNGAVDIAQAALHSKEMLGAEEAKQIEIEMKEYAPRFLRNMDVRRLAQKTSYRNISASAAAKEHVHLPSWKIKPGEQRPTSSNIDGRVVSMSAIAQRQGQLQRERRELKRLEKQQGFAMLENRATSGGGAGEMNEDGETKMVTSFRAEIDEGGADVEGSRRGIRSVRDLPKVLPPWMKSGIDGPIAFGPKSALSIQEQRKKLPIAEYKQYIIDHIRDHSVTVLVGEPGSGKTTQLTQYLYEAGYGNKKGQIIGCTQPRRVAAISVAERVADEFGCRVGEEIGYAVRFSDVTSSLTKIKYMTDGMLLREALLDDTFEKYSVMILDEAHERSINTDVLFGMMKAALKKRPNDLKLIVTSATLDIDRFCSFFETPDCVKIPGKTFPVDIRWHEPADDYLNAAVDLVMQIHLEEPPGDILVFLTGQDEIETAAQRLYNRTQQIPGMPELLILPIYSALPNEVQSRVFDKTPEDSRKVVLATNIAETSITIDGLLFVIDPGFCKLKMYNPTTGVEQLKVVPISKSQANQRAGRAGRTAPGRCYRLYQSDHYEEEMAAATEPEIRRSNLANVVLTLKAVGIVDLLNFDFMDPPAKETLFDAMEKLFYLGALDDDGLLTILGRRMSELPVEPTLSKTLLTAVDMACVEPVLICVAMLMAPNIFYRPREKQEEADLKKSFFNQPEGDQISLISVYDAWAKAGRTDQWCRNNFINARALNDAAEARNQLEGILGRRRSGAAKNNNNEISSSSSTGYDFAKVRKALTSGYFFQVAKRGNDGRYFTTSDRREVAIHPSSALFHIQPKYVCYHELVLTSREYMRQIMVVDPEWLVELAPQYYSKPRAGKLTSEQMAQRLDPVLRRWEKGNDWRISKLRRKR